MTVVTPWARAGHVESADIIEPRRGFFRLMAMESVDVARWAQTERLRLVFSNLPVTLVVSVASASILAALLRHTVSPPILLGWLVTGILISCLRYLDYRQFRRAATRAERALRDLQAAQIAELTATRSRTSRSHSRL